jgi:serralysin
VITDFRRGQHDHIDLSAIDADAGVGGDQGFVFRGTHAFTGAGQIRYVLHDHAGTANDTTMIFGSTDADHAPEFQIEVKGLVHFAAGDFFL